LPQIWLKPRIAKRELHILFIILNTRNVSVQ